MNFIFHQVDRIILQYSVWNSKIKSIAAADFECIAEDIICDDCELEDEQDECASCKKKNTKQTKRYKPIAYALKLCSQFEEYDLEVESYFGEDCVKHFINR